MPLEDAADDEMAHREAGPELVIDVGHRLGRACPGLGVGAAGTLMLMDRQTQSCRCTPERVVALVVVGLDRVVGWHCRQHHAADRRTVGAQCISATAASTSFGRSWISPRRAVGCSFAEVDQPPIVGLEPGPSAFEVLPITRDAAEVGEDVVERRQRVREDDLAGHALVVECRASALAESQLRLSVVSNQGW